MYYDVKESGKRIKEIRKKNGYVHFDWNEPFARSKYTNCYSKVSNIGTKKDRYEKHDIIMLLRKNLIVLKGFKN